MGSILEATPVLLLIGSVAFGFLGGREAKDAGVANAGLHDRKYQSFSKASVRLTILHQNVKP